jgi:fumarate hydratase class II
LLLMVDFMLLNGDVGEMKLEKMDEKIWQAINRELKVSGCQGNSITHQDEIVAYRAQISLTGESVSDSIVHPSDAIERSQDSRCDEMR